MDEHLAELARITETLAEHVANLSQRLSGQRWCPFCQADRSESWRSEPHKPDCIVTRAEVLARALTPLE